MLTMAIPDVDILAVRLFTVFLMYSPHGAKLYGSRGGEVEGPLWSVWGLKVVKSC